MNGICPVREGARFHPTRAALRFEGREWSYSALDTEVGKWVSALIRRGVKAGDRVAVLSKNHPHLVHLFFALGRLDATVAPLNARLTSAELKPLLGRLRASLTLVQPELQSLIPEGLSLADMREVTEPTSELISPRQSPRALLFTSGTTGQPKGTLLTEANFRASAEASAKNLGRTGIPRWLGTLPLFHVGGLAMLYRSVYEGGCLLLQANFDEAAVQRALDEEGATHLSLVATTLERLLVARQGRPFPQQPVALIGGGPVLADLLARSRALGLRALQTYGLTEACSQVCTERPGEETGTTAGPPLDSLEVRIVEGQIEVKGPTLMAGYFEDEAATQSAIQDGWLRTGDLGQLDEQGRLQLLARRTDLIVCGGENVYPAEVEAVLNTHPAIGESAVVGIADARWGEVPVAVLVLKQLPFEGDEALRNWCRERLATFKVPHRFAVVLELPRNAIGKIERFSLKLLFRVEAVLKDVGS